MESFDLMSELTEHAGKTIAKSPYGKQVFESPFYRKNVRDLTGVPRNLMPKLYPLQVGFRKCSQSGLKISNWWQYLGTCADDLAIVCSM